MLFVNFFLRYLLHWRSKRMYTLSTWQRMSRCWRSYGSWLRSWWIQWRCEWNINNRNWVRSTCDDERSDPTVSQNYHFICRWSCYVCSMSGWLRLPNYICLLRACLSTRILLGSIVYCVYGMWSEFIFFRINNFFWSVQRFTNNLLFRIFLNKFFYVLFYL